MRRGRDSGTLQKKAGKGRVDGQIFLLFMRANLQQVRWLEKTGDPQKAFQEKKRRQTCSQKQGEFG